jgi:dihydropteroate synthase
VIIDAGCDLGKTWQQSLELLRHSDVLAGMGWPLLLSASNKTFLGKLLDLDIKDRREASHSAHALGILRGCRVLRAHDVKGARRVVDVLSAVLAS